MTYQKKLPIGGMSRIADFAFEHGARRAAPAPLDPEFVARCKASLADPRPSLPAEEVRSALRARHDARLKRGA